MSERLTSASAPGIVGIEKYGRKTRAEMIKQYRDHFERQKAQAELALSYPDDKIEVYTYLGAWAQRKLEVVED